MQTDSSASFTWRLSLSGSEWTATVLMPISLQARMIRTAISPRLAIRIFLNMPVAPVGHFHLKKRLAVFHRVTVGHQGLQDPAAHLGHDVFADLHGFDRRHRLS